MVHPIGSQEGCHKTGNFRRIARSKANPCICTEHSCHWHRVSQLVLSSSSSRAANAKGVYDRTWSPAEDGGLPVGGGSQLQGVWSTGSVAHWWGGDPLPQERFLSGIFNFPRPCWLSTLLSSRTNFILLSYQNEKKKPKGQHLKLCLFGRKFSSIE